MDSSLFQPEAETSYREYVVQVLHPKHGRVFMEPQTDLAAALERVEAHRLLGTQPILFRREIEIVRGAWVEVKA